MSVEQIETHRVFISSPSVGATGLGRSASTVWRGATSCSAFMVRDVIAFIKLLTYLLCIPVMYSAAGCSLHPPHHQVSAAPCGALAACGAEPVTATRTSRPGMGGGDSEES